MAGLKVKLGLSVVLLGWLLFMYLGGTLTPEERRGVMVEFVDAVPQQLRNGTLEHAEYFLQTLDATYLAVDGTKQAAVLWLLVAWLAFRPVMFLVRSLVSCVLIVLEFLRPYLALLWPLVSTFCLWVWDWLGYAFDVLKPYAASAGVLAMEYGGSLVAWLAANSKVLFAAAVVAVHRCWVLFWEQDTWNIVMEFATVAAILLLWMLQRLIVRKRVVLRLKRQYERVRAATRARYRLFLEGVQRKSRTAATFIPHLLLCIPVALAVYFLPDIVASMSQGYILLVISLVYPTISTVHSLQNKRVSEMHKCLMYWVVFSVIAFVHSVVPYIPFGLRIVGAVPYLQELGFVLFVWLQLPWTDGSAHMYRFIVPILNKYVRSIPAVPAPATQEQRNFIIKLVVNTFVSEERRASVLEILLHGGNMLLGIVFFFTPTYFTGLGCLIMGMGMPNYMSISALGRFDATTVNSSEGSDSPASTDSPRPGSDQAQVCWWLKYWVVFFAFSTLHDGLTTTVGLENFPLWYHAKLAVVLWLQFPVFKGAQQVYAQTIERVYAFFQRFVGTAGSDSQSSGSAPDLAVAEGVVDGVPAVGAGGSAEPRKQHSGINPFQQRDGGDAVVADSGGSVSQRAARFGGISSGGSTLTRRKP